MNTSLLNNDGKIRIAVLADVHLNGLRNTAQYAALHRAAGLIAGETPDLIVSLGDATAFGNPEEARYYQNTLTACGIPMIGTAGNSDLRTPETAEETRRILHTPPVFSLGGWTVLALDNAGGSFTPEGSALLEKHGSDDRLLLCMHIPFMPGSPEMPDVSARRVLTLSGHLHHVVHRLEKGRELLSVRAADPDKAIGAPPSLTMIELDGDKMTFRELPLLPVEEDITPWLGFSCYRPLEDVELAMACGVKKIEFRPDVVRTDRAQLCGMVDAFRKNGGDYVSIHLPDMPENGPDESLLRCLDLAARLDCDGLTIHIPNITPARFADDPVLFRRMAGHYAAMIGAFSDKTTVCIENMHTRKGERSFSARRYGCDPAEMLAFLSAVRKTPGGERARLLLDVGHARNNMPLNQPYPVSVWYAGVGQACGAYHIHQMNAREENHTPILSLNSVMINYTSFLWSWQNGLLSHGPCIIEVADPEGKRQTLRTFRQLRQKEDNLPV